MIKSRKKYISYFLIILTIVIVWEIFATLVGMTKRTPENILPHLHKVILFVFSKEKLTAEKTALQTLALNTSITLSRALIGFVIGTVVGYLMAIIMKISGVVEKILFPYLMIIQIIPVLGMAPLIYSLTGDINKSRIIISVLLTFYPVAANTLAGFNSVKKEKLELMKVLSASKFEIFTKLLVPSSLPYFFTGLKVSAPMAMTASILVDTLQGEGGLGCLLVQSLKHAVSIYYFWSIIFLCIFIGILIYNSMKLIEKMLYKDPDFND